jgi:signal transduction histidine kinase
MKSIFATIGALFLLLTWLLVNGLNLNSKLFDREVQALEDFIRCDRSLHREVLTARAGLSRNYDGFVRTVDGLNVSLDHLRSAARGDPEQLAAVERLAKRAATQESLIEQFKSQNALLQNSLAYFELFSSRLAAADRNGPVVASTTRLDAAMLHLTLDTSPSAARDVQDRLDELAAVQHGADDEESIQALLAHGHMLHDLLPATDAVMKMLFAVAGDPEQDVLRTLIVKRQVAARASARHSRLLLYATSLLLLVVLVHLGVRLRARTYVLQWRAAFEHVIAGISTGFINSQNHEIATDVERALGELAECAGADRAYFVMAAEPKRVYRWCRESAPFPAGWPEQALDIASRLPRGPGGVIHVPHIGRPRSGEVASLLAVAGLHDWLCVPSTGGNRAAAVLGFDALRGGAFTQSNEVGLFRMAFDAIANAVSRVILEQEKERLEASLQQARRMETVGAFASGIAHNFNNIVAAILGYTEMANAHVRSGGRPAGSLAEIRRAGERARELIDQILTFGRRGDGRRERVCVKLLVAETRSLLAVSLPPHIAVEVEEKTSESTFVSAQSAQLQQVVLNICNNAAQAMEEPGVIRIGIETRQLKTRSRVGFEDMGPGCFTIISVSDTGRGMDEATLERIFEPFFTTRLAGNGLGLATARIIVQEHEGAMKVESAVGVGTRFEIWLPRVSQGEPVSLAHAPGIVGRGIGETVLVFETNRERLLRHEEILAALGYEPVGFVTAAEAEEACHASPERFDAALVCHHSGTTSALDFAIALHELAPGLPIVLATPSARALGAPSLAASGISEVVQYPLASSELARALLRCLATSAAPMLQS